MGLLDEAIREHLELKRRQGADPSEIARKEREALNPAFPEEAVALDEVLGAAPHDTPVVPGELEPAGVPPVEDYAALEAQVEDFSNVGQETAELDMRAVLDGDGEEPADASPVDPVAAAPVRAVRSGELPEEDSPEREALGRSVGEPALEDVPGQERLSFE
jgi:hypothetical protein